MKSARYIRPSHTPQTHLSDFCELSVVSNFNSLNEQELKVFLDKYDKLSPFERWDQLKRSSSMSSQIVKHLTTRYPKDYILQVRWCGRRGILQKMLGTMATPNHPADILIVMSNGNIGVSLKSTEKTRDCAFGHYCVNTLDKSLGVMYGKDVQRMFVYHNLPNRVGKRKQYLRTHPTVRQNTLEDGEQVLARLTKKYFTLLQRKHRAHQLRKWLLDTFTGRTAYPPFLIVTGRQNEDATLLDPLYSSTPLIRELSNTSSRLCLRRLGRHSIGIAVGGAKTMLLRFKWESEPMASSLKVSAEPWV